MKVSVPGSTFLLLDVIHYGVVGLVALASLVGLFLTLTRALRAMLTPRSSKAEAPEAGWGERLRPILAPGALGAAGLVAAACSFLWVSNTEVPEFDWSAEVPTVEPGGTVTIVGDESCDPSGRFVLRHNVLGRWQRTHDHGEPSVRNWWDTHSESWAYNAVCMPAPGGRFDFAVPESVSPGVVALCGAGTSCAKVRVVAPAESG